MHIVTVQRVAAKSSGQTWTAHCSRRAQLAAKTRRNGRIRVAGKVDTWAGRGGLTSVTIADYPSIDAMRADDFEVLTADNTKAEIEREAMYAAMDAAAFANRGQA